jgi:hypothetical protein
MNRLHAGFRPPLIPNVRNLPGCSLAMEFLAAYAAHAADDRFSLIDTLRLSVPQDWKDETCFTELAEQFGHDFQTIGDSYLRGAAGKPAIPLVPGQTLELDLFRVKAPVSYIFYRAYLWSQSALLFGARGCVLSYLTARESLPSRAALISADEVEYQQGCHAFCSSMEDAETRDGSKWWLGLRDIEDMIRPGSVLLAFRAGA